MFEFKQTNCMEFIKNILCQSCFFIIFFKKNVAKRRKVRLNPNTKAKSKRKANMDIDVFLSHLKRKYDRNIY